MTRAHESTGGPLVLAARALIVLATLAVFASLTVQAAPRPWTESRSAHFRVVSADQVAAERLAAELETFRSVLERRGHAVHLDLEAPVLVVLADGRDFTEAASALGVGPGVAAGFALVSDGAPCLVVHRNNALVEPRGIAYRAYLHLVLDRSQSTPPWFREGLAEYYRTFSVDGRNVLIGRAEESYIEYLRLFSFLPFEMLFTLDRAQIEALPDRERAQFAAQAWALVHWRFSAGYEGKRQLARVMGLMEAGLAPEAAVREAMGVDLAGLDRELRRYVKQRRFTYTSVTYDDLAAPQVASAPANRDDVLGELALAADSDGELVSIVSGPAEVVPADYPRARESL